MNSSSPAHHVANNTLVGWVATGTDRGTLDIIYASGVTIVLCVWVSTYPNVPAPSDRWYHHIVDKANLAMIGALGPDLLFGLALGQYSSAKRSIEAFKSEWPDRPWTITHAFYADMGGFRVTSGRDSYSVPVNAQQLLYLIKYGYVAFPTVSQEDLIAMSSGDLFSKVIVIWQVIWFVITTIMRLVKGMPITTLEVTAFIFAVMMMATSVAWFQKPQISVSTAIHLTNGMSFEDVRQCAQRTTHPTMKDWHETPFDFIWKRGCFKGDKHWQFMSRLSHQAFMPFFTRLPGQPWARMPSDIWIQPQGTLTVLGAMLQVPFSLSFLWAWNFHFATETERILWRSSAIYHAVYTCIITVYYLYWLDAPGTPQSNPDEPFPSREPMALENGQNVPFTSQEEKSHGVSVKIVYRMLQRYLAQWRNTSPTQDPDQNVSLRWTFCIFSLTVIYIFAHLFIYFEDFISLRSQPADIFQTPNQYFPLIN